MKCAIPEISWHNRDPVLSIDIQPKTCSGSKDFYRLASGGTDSHVLIWYLKEDENSHVNLELAADLTRHQRAVNCVRWSPSGELLASGDDESIIFIWKLKSETETLNILDNANEQDKEIWLTFKILRGHMEDIYDLSWSPNSLNLISGSVDNAAMVWDVQKGKALAILTQHKSFVQGVAWDPKNQYLATLSADRYMRVFDVNTKKIVARSSKSIVPVPKDSSTKEKMIRLYHDDTLQTFYRRLSFSPDGEILITPSGSVCIDGEKSLNTSYLYTRHNLKRPSVVLPSPDQYTVAVRFCPLLFELHEHNESNPPIIGLPYRMIFAVASKSSVYLYDTQQKMPFGVVSNIHYTRLTDLTWSSNGRMLLVSSTDGFCTLITFSDGELGAVYVKKEDKPLPVNVNSENNNDEKVNKLEDKKGMEKIVEKSASSSLETTTVDEPSERTILTPEGKKMNAGKAIKIDIPETIISSEEKFKSPEIKNQPATPIQIRREPKSSAKVAKELTYNVPTQPNSPDSNKQLKSSTSKTPKNGSSNKATPIAVRRKPRAILAATVARETTTDEALDAWPIDQPRPEKNASTNSINIEKPSISMTSRTEPMEIDDNTENIRLIYEDDSQVSDDLETDEQMIADKPLSDNNTPNSKTPRRVELRTISTPKSKKKL